MKNALRIAGTILAVLFVVIVALGIARRLVGPSRVATETQSTVTEIARVGRIEDTISARGNVVADRETTLAFTSSGLIAEVLVQDGQEVEAGQALARLDTTSLEWQVARSEASLETARARLEQVQKPAAEEDLASAQAALESAIASYENVMAGATAEEIASARASFDSAQANYEKVQAGPTAADLASAKAALDSAEASLQQAQASYDQVKDRPNVQMLPQSLTLQTATIEYERAKANYNALANHPTKSELASARAQMVQAEAQLTQLLQRPTATELAAAAAQTSQAEAQLAQLQQRPNPEDVAVQEAQVEEATLALDQTRSQLEDAIILAPHAGTITAVQVREGEWASPGVPAVTVATVEPLVMAVNVDEIDIAQLAEGQMAHLSFDAIKGAEIVGTVTHIASLPTNVGGAIAYSVEISFTPGDLPIRLGMTSDVDIVVASADDALLVPNRAIEADRETGRYFVMRQGALGTTERVEVQIGLRDESDTQILEGVSEGDTLVLPEVPAQGQDDGFSGPGGMFGGMRDRGGQ